MLGSSTVLDSTIENSELGVVPRLCQALFDRVRELQSASNSAKAPRLPQPSSSEDKENADALPNPPNPMAQDGALISAGVAVSFYEIYNEQVRDLFSR